MSYQILEEFPDRNIEAKWIEFLANAKMPTHYTTPDFFVDPFIRGGKRFAILISDEQEKIIAVLTGVFDGRVINSGMAVRPQTAFRKNADLPSIAKKLLGALKAKGGTSLQLVKFFTWSPQTEFERIGFRARVSKGSECVMLLDLSRGSEALFRDFSQTRRNEIRKALKENALEIKDLTTEKELDELYSIHVDWCHRKNISPDTLAEMQLVVSQTDNRKIIIAKKDDRVIAGSYYRFCKGGMVEYAGNNSLPEFQKFRPNDLIGWRSIQWACESGFSHYSMGGSHLFLRRFGGSEVAPVRYSLDLTLFRRYEKKEAARDFVTRSYQSLPSAFRDKVKLIRGKS